MERGTGSGQKAFRPLLWLAAGAAFGAYGCSLCFLNGWKILLGMMIAAVTLVAAAICIWGFQSRTVLFFYGMIAMLLWCNIWIGVARKPLLLTEGHTMPIECRLTGYAQGKETYGTAEGILLKVGDEKLRRKVSVILEDGSPHYEPGEILKGNFRVTSTSRETAVGWVQKGCFYQITQRGKLITEKTEEMPLICRSAIWQRKIETLMTKLLPQREAALLTALLTGEKDGFTAEQKRELRLSGTAHIAAVSGLHIAAVCFLLTIIFGKRAGLLLGIPAAIGYAFLAGFTPSALRAAIMAVLGSLAFFLKEEKDGMAALAAAAIMLLCARPLMILDAGFLLSFAAATGILLFFPRMQAVLLRQFNGRRIDQRLLLAVFSGLGVCLSAQVFTLPLTCFLFRRVSVVTLATNALISPLLSVVLLGGFALLPLAAVSFQFAKIAAIAEGTLLKIIGFIQEKSSAVPFHSVPAESIYIRVLAIIAMILFLLWVRKKLSGCQLALIAASISVFCLGAIAVENYYFPKITVTNCGGSALFSYEQRGKMGMVLSGTFRGDAFFMGAQQELEREGKREIETLLLTTSKGYPPYREEKERWAVVRRAFAPASLSKNFLGKAELFVYGGAGRMGEDDLQVSLFGEEPYTLLMQRGHSKILSGCGIKPEEFLKTVKSEQLRCDVLVLDAKSAEDPQRIAAVCAETRTKMIFCIQPNYQGEEFTLGNIAEIPVVYLPNQQTGIIQGFYGGGSSGEKNGSL